MACGIYYFCVKAIIEETGNINDRLQKGMDKAFSYYRQDLSNNSELDFYNRLSDVYSLSQTNENDIGSSGYVVASLEAAIWCLATTNTYSEAVLKAVNLGEDTDTVGAITGALAGLYYGEEGIPAEWIEAIQRREFIEEILQK